MYAQYLRFLPVAGLRFTFCVLRFIPIAPPAPVLRTIDTCLTNTSHKTNETAAINSKQTIELIDAACVTVYTQSTQRQLRMFSPTT